MVIIEFLQSILLEVLIYMLGILTANIGRLLIFLKSNIFFKKDIRMSMSYIFRIKLENKYLLVRGSNISQYQPVGGVYKYYKSFYTEKDNIGVVDDKNFYENGDLRVNVKGSKVSKFLKWFDSRKNREVSVHREFIEELIDNMILPPKVLNNFNPEFIKQKKLGIRYSPHFKTYELLIFDVFEIELEDEYKQLILKNIEEYSDLSLVTAEEINSECFDYQGISMKIGEHAKFII